jgi:hypothetical protein
VVWPKRQNKILISHWSGFSDFRPCEHSERVSDFGLLHRVKTGSDPVYRCGRHMAPASSPQLVAYRRQEAERKDPSSVPGGGGGMEGVGWGGGRGYRKAKH